MNDEESTGVCIVCGKDGAPYQRDPYREELFGDETLVPLHDGECYQEQVWDI